MAGARQVLVPERLRVCVACHAESTLQKPYAGPAPYAVAYPPYRLFPDHALEIGHKTHRAIACAQCHGETRGPPHRRCAGCHDGAAAPGHGPAMAACARCHAPASGVPDPPKLLMTSQIEILVTTAFSHGKHAARGAAGRQCATCHGAILETDDRQLPRPTAADCAAAGCHDGKAAFATTAACTRCHQDVPKARFEVGAARQALLARDAPPCAARRAPPATRSRRAARCWSRTTRRARRATPTTSAKRRPTTCGACHNATEPWRALTPTGCRGSAPSSARRSITASTRRRARRCHALTTAAAQLRPPRGHRACTGAGCHAVAGGPAPALEACEGCHEEGRAGAREQARLQAPWSVRAAFDHATHRRSKTGELACVGCHADLSAPDVKTLKTPPKAACAGCHDGAAAFKLTGTTCTKCHRGTSPGR